MPRAGAWMILRGGSPTPLREVDDVAAYRGLDDRDRGLLRKLVGTEIRHRGTLRALVRSLGHGKLKPDLLTHLHLGMVQLLYLDRVPEHAALSETLRATHDSIGQSKVRVVNAFLHNVLRERREGTSGDPRRDLVGRPWHFDVPVFRDPEEHPHLWAEDALSMPAPLMKRWSKRLGRERAERLARFFLLEPRPVVRSLDDDSAERTAALLRSLELDPRPTTVPGSFAIAAEDVATLARSEAFTSERLIVQGEAAQAAVALVDARPGERVLDLCAAPGGKSLALAARGASVVACDDDAWRLSALPPAAARLGLAERITALTCDAADALAPDERFDAVLVDAPCSNTGVLGARPGARWRFGPRGLRELQALQLRLLAAASTRVRPGGRLVWSTCSLEPEENGQLLKRFLEEHPRFTLEEEHTSLPDAETGPFDGGNAARLRRSTEPGQLHHGFLAGPGA